MKHEPSKSFLRRAAISPIAGVKLAAKNMIIYEAEYNTFKDWSLHVGNFQFRVWFIFVFFWCVILFC